MVTCVSCDFDFTDAEIKYTYRNEERLPLCLPCWNAAIQVQRMLAVENRAEDARKRWEHKQEIEKLIS